MLNGFNMGIIVASLIVDFEYEFACRVGENELLNWCLVKCFPSVMDTNVLEHLEIAKHFNLSDEFFHVVPPEYTKKSGFPVLLRNIK